MKIIFLSQGPKFEASSAPFRLLKNYACKDPIIARECRFENFAIRADLACDAGDSPVEAERKAYATSEQILGSDPDLLALSLYCWNSSSLLRIARLCKALKPELRVVAGGPDSYGRGKELLREHAFLDAVIDSEGEYSFAKLLEYYLTGKTSIEQSSGPLVTSLRKARRESGLGDIPFLSYREGDKLERGTNEFFFSDLDEIPSPILGESADALKTRFYVEQASGVIVETSRGCPVNCAFCQYPKNNDGKMRYFGIERVLSELRHIQSVGIRAIYFGDGIFTIRRERAQQFFQFFLEQFTDCEIHVELKLDTLHASLIPFVRELIAQDRLSTGIGLQSVNKRTLDRIGRPTNLEKLCKTVKELGSARRMRWDLICGLPGDTLADVAEGIEFIYENAPGARVALQPLLVLPGTAMWHDARDFGLVFQRSDPYVALCSDTFSFADSMRSDVMRAFCDLFGGIFEAAADPRGLGLDLRGFWRELFAPEFHPELEAGDRTLHTFWRLVERSRRLLRSRMPEAQWRSVSEALEWAVLGLVGPDSLGELQAPFSHFVSHVSSPRDENGANGSLRWASVLDSAHVFRFSHSFNAGSLRRSERDWFSSHEPIYSILIGAKLYSFTPPMFRLLAGFELPHAPEELPAELADIPPHDVHAWLEWLQGQDLLVLSKQPSPVARALERA